MALCDSLGTGDAQMRVACLSLGVATCGVALSSAVALQSPRVVVREVPGMGLGVFAEELIACGSFVCDYEGEVVDTAEICRRYAPEMEPEYAQGGRRMTTHAHSRFLARSKGVR